MSASPSKPYLPRDECRARVEAIFKSLEGHLRESQKSAVEAQLKKFLPFWLALDFSKVTLTQDGRSWRSSPVFHDVPYASALKAKSDLANAIEARRRPQIDKQLQRLSAPLIDALAERGILRHAINAYLDDDDKALVLAKLIREIEIIYPETDGRIKRGRPSYDQYSIQPPWQIVVEQIILCLEVAGWNMELPANSPGEGAQKKSHRRRA